MGKKWLDYSWKTPLVKQEKPKEGEGGKGSTKGEKKTAEIVYIAKQQGYETLRLSLKQALRAQSDGYTIYDKNGNVITL